MSISKELGQSLDSLKEIIRNAETWLRHHPCGDGAEVSVHGHIEAAVPDVPLLLRFDGDSIVLAVDFEYMDDVRFNNLRLTDEDLSELKEQYPTTLGTLSVVDRERCASFIPALIANARLNEVELPERIVATIGDIQQALLSGQSPDSSSGVLIQW